MNASRTNCADGFTLVELVLSLLLGLAVIAVVAPALRLAVAESPRVACIEHLRELGQSHLAWAEDYNGWLVLNPRNSDGSPEFTMGNFLSNQLGFDNHAVDLGTQDYVANPQIWACPSDRFDGPADDIPVTPATIYGPSFNKYQNISYYYIAGYNTASTGDPSTTPVLADESNEREYGIPYSNVQPFLDSDDNHGAAYRNALYLDGHVTGISGTNEVNHFLPAFADPWYLQAID